ncbi:recombinase family protein [Streptomyces sp. OfavH-34-F]|uniref:recombinase family protein n=1 Tax=Streptomyces sp. OfavH-34-F TaxID=2917760 RepID=UPI001EF1A18F|nr:recombinase family protein [Streptomyces sp. OfavH-34-F]MCG7523360.1 recombinase family protein [Streptomyces sp. OfavH-34-F]
MPINPPGGLGHVPVAVYSCATTSTALGESEERGRCYADARHWHVAGVWSDPAPSLPLMERPGWRAVTAALSAGMIRGVVVSGLTHVAADAAQFAALGVLLRDRGGFLADGSSGTPPRRTPDQARRRRGIGDAASGWFTQTDAYEGDDL